MTPVRIRVQELTTENKHLWQLANDVVSQKIFFQIIQLKHTMRRVAGLQVKKEAGHIQPPL